MADDAQVDLYGKIASRVTFLGTVIAAVVGINTALTTCSESTVARYKSFQAAVDAEEAFWKQRFDDYIGSFSETVRPEERSRKLYALSALAQREIPTFDEHQLGLLDSRTSREVARKRLTTLRERLVQALDREASSSSEVVQARREETFAGALVTQVRDRSQHVPEEPPVSAANNQGEAISFQTRTLAKGDRLGWDIDVFWCAGGDSAVELRNYLDGSRLGMQLAELANRRDRIGGEKVGRIRLVPLPESRQGNNNGINLPERGEGYQIRPEPSEERFAGPLLHTLATQGWQFSRTTSDTPTRWYISLFACRHGSATAPSNPAMESATVAR